MEITGSRSWILRIPFLQTSADEDGAHHEIVGVTLEGSDGTTGMGFAWVPDGGAGRAVQVFLDDVLLPRLPGRSALDVAAIWQESFVLTHRMGTGINRFAMAAIDIALWDLRATSHGVSLAREIGQLTDRVPVYGSGKAGVRLSIDELAALSKGYVDDGFDAVKVRVGLEPDLDVARIRAVREAVGPDVKIMTDANERLDLPTALDLGGRLADEGVFWFEEPLLSTDVEGHRQLARALPIPIAGGEHHTSAAEFVPHVDRRAFAVLQPNVCMVGGVTEMLRISRLAELHGLAYAPHAIVELHVHLAAASPASTYLEYFPFLDPFTSTSLTVEDGSLIVPDGPGHGMAFSDDAFARYRTG